MTIPGTVIIEVRAITSNRSERGRVVSCGRCRTLCEIVEHG